MLLKYLADAFDKRIGAVIFKLRAKEKRANPSRQLRLLFNVARQDCRAFYNLQLDDDMDLRYNFIMQSENKKRILWLDLARVISIFFVIIIHAASPLYNNWELPPSEWMAGNIYNSIARVSVPLLFMISGYLLLNRQESIRSFYVKRAQKVVVPLLAWSIIYLLWTNHGYSNFTFINALKAIVFAILKGPASYHLWFVYTLLAIYLFVPILRTFIRAADETTLWYFALIWFVLGPLLDYVEQRFLNFNISINLGFFTEYIGYFYVGFMIGRMNFSRRVSNLAGLVYVALTIFTIYETYAWGIIKGSYFDFYHNYLRLNIVVMTVCAFIWLKYMGEKLEEGSSERSARLIRHLSGATFGIYLIHVMILALLKWGSFGFKLTPFSMAPIAMVPLLALVVLIISYIVVAILQRIPYVRAIVP